MSVKLRIALAAFSWTISVLEPNNPTSVVTADDVASDSSSTAASDWLNVNPLLGPLQDNRGPTPTMALLPGSPAIDAGTLTDSEWDQRGPGYPRLVNGATDIGANEVQD